MTGKSLRLTFKGDKVCVTTAATLPQPKRKRSKKSSEERTRKRGTSFYNDESDAEMYGGDEQSVYRRFFSNTQPGFQPKQLLKFAAPPLCIIGRVQVPLF